MANFSIQECLPEHLPQVLNIYNHYVRHTIITFDIEEQPLSYVQGTYESVQEAKLPYLVALLPTSSPMEKGTVMGYTYATQFRPRRAYAASVEISLFCHPDYKGRGCGSRLLEALIQALREVPVSEARENGVKEMLAVCSLDPANDVRDFYRKLGFKDRGHLRNVGCKFGKWWDTAYSQLSLRSEEENRDIEDGRETAGRV
ncbi:uncharacterized protein KY384_000964 [Bacidia gigantensis]|uniref:uncharacterized protein n=1 Tax=Bacidia gigantensis TaxID=2732470 RepID=UPI001D05784D|nr:uncharacterized protein KY384_000964 [Bacidia gigantensis]KAG8534120.1 hypothetical protein KY384_000964 [Bacidia gigantensis]